MTINLPEDLEDSIKAAVDEGRFASVDDAMVAAARLLLLRQDQGRPADQLHQASDAGPDLFLGSMRDDAELMDEIVADAYRKRREETWRDIPLE